MVAAGLAGLVSPAWAARLVRAWRAPAHIYLAAAIRLALGVFLLVAASSCRFPLFVQIIGAVAILAALSLPFLGIARVQALIDWWSRQPAAFVRGWCLLAVAFGALLIFAAI